MVPQCLRHVLQLWRMNLELDFPRFNPCVQSSFDATSRDRVPLSSFSPLTLYLPSFLTLSFFIIYQFIRVIEENLIIGRSVVKEKGREKGGEEKREKKKCPNR